MYVSDAVDALITSLLALCRPPPHPGASSPDPSPAGDMQGSSGDQCCEGVGGKRQKGESTAQQQRQRQQQGQQQHSPGSCPQGQKRRRKMQGGKEGSDHQTEHANGRGVHEAQGTPGQQQQYRNHSSGNTTEVLVAHGRNRTAEGLFLEKVSLFFHFCGHTHSYFFCFRKTFAVASVCFFEQ